MSNYRPNLTVVSAVLIATACLISLLCHVANQTQQPPPQLSFSFSFIEPSETVPEEPLGSTQANSGASKSSHWKDSRRRYLREHARKERHRDAELDSGASSSVRSRNATLVRMQRQRKGKTRPLEVTVISHAHLAYDPVFTYRNRGRPLPPNVTFVIEEPKMEFYGAKEIVSKEAEYEPFVASKTYSQSAYKFHEAVSREIELSERNGGHADVEAIVNKYAFGANRSIHEKERAGILDKSEPYERIHDAMLYYSPRGSIDLVVVLHDAEEYSKLLTHWDLILREYHIIIILEDSLPLTYFQQTPNPLPPWLDYELYTKQGLKSSLSPEDTWIIDGIPSKSNAYGDSIDMVTFGAWISDKNRVFVIDVYNKPVFLKDMGSDGLSWIQQHVDSLKSPAMIFYHTGVTDVYRPGFDFPRGLPYQLRKGSNTAVSHGMVTGEPDYDPITMLIKEHEKHDAKGKVNSHAQAIPVGVMYSLSLSNIAYSAQYVGPSLMIFKPGGNDFLEYDSYRDVIAGWMMKATLDKMGHGVKVGLPVIQRTNRSSINRSPLLQQLINDFGMNNASVLQWEQEIFEYFRLINRDPLKKHSLSSLDSPHIFFRELDFYQKFVKEVRTTLGSTNAYIGRMCQTMLTWIDIWNARKGFMGAMLPVSSMRAKGPHPDGNQCALITIPFNEKFMLPYWFRYYSQHFAVQDIYLLDHQTTDGSTDPSLFPPGTNILTLEGNRYRMPVAFRSAVVKTYQDRLLRYGYKCVVFADTDEFIVPNPVAYPKGLRQYIDKFVADDSRIYAKVVAKELGHMSWGNGSASSQEPPLDWSKPFLSQRRYYTLDVKYDKPLITKRPITFRPGFHRTYDFRLNDKMPKDPDLAMFHLRSMDKDFCYNRTLAQYNMSSNMDPLELSKGYAYHWNHYQELKKSGELCKFAIAGYFGKENKDTKYWDNTGIYPMLKLRDIWTNQI